MNDLYFLFKRANAVSEVTLGGVDYDTEVAETPAVSGAGAPLNLYWKSRGHLCRHSKNASPAELGR